MQNLIFRCSADCCQEMFAECFAESCEKMLWKNK